MFRSWKRAIRGNLLYYSVLSSAMVFFVILTLDRLRQLVPADDLWYLVSAKTLFSHHVLLDNLRFSALFLDNLEPGLYLRLLVLAFRFFGESEMSGRVVGIISGLLSILLVAAITKYLVHGNESARKRWSAFSALAYALAPTTIQGAVMFQVDTTLMVPSLLCLLWATVRYLQEKRFVWAFAIVATTTVALWERLASPAVVILFLIGFIAAIREELKMKVASIISIVLGALLFWLTWIIYTQITRTPHRAQLDFTLLALTDRIIRELHQFFRGVIQFILWLGVFSPPLLVFVIWRRLRSFFLGSKVRPEDVFLLCGVFFLIGYLLIGGIVFGFPRYHSPFIPMFYVGAAIVLSRHKSDYSDLSLRYAAVIGGIAFAVQVVAIGDPLYFLRYSLREALAVGPLQHQALLKPAVLKLAFLSLACIFLWSAFLRSGLRKSIGGVLLAVFLGSSAGLSFLQATATYHTGYNYGEQGRMEAVKYISERTPWKSAILAPSEIIYYLRSPGAVYLSDDFWDDAAQIRERLADPRVSAIAVSVTGLEIGQVSRVFSDKEIVSILHHDFENAKIGSYFIWIRNGNSTLNRKS